jgi:alanyl-tRNA synthetase
MTASDIRTSFIDFFKEKQHTFAQSSSLLPDDPTLPNFTNAGMNQFVPIFLGREAVPFSPARAANTQKCIRAGGKHNDLDDVGHDTYHHTFFEMLGNWSFGDYFKKEAISWAWELLVERWKLPKERLYFTVYGPEEGEPGEPDTEAHALWSAVCRDNGLDPDVHVIYCGKADNFWMMGDTGPCGPCSEIHMDLTENGDTGGALVNKDDHRCIEIWNLVFIQNNATPDGQFLDLPSTHVDTGMGFERVAAAIQCTKNFTDFSKPVSNYETDVFAPIFAAISALCGHDYGCTLVEHGNEPTEEEARDIAFRVIADHLRCVSVAISDDIIPFREGRGYVLRRIIRRAARYARTLGIEDPFLNDMVGVVVDQLGEVFPELVAKQESIEKYIRSEEESFKRNLDRGIVLFEKVKAEVVAKGGSRISGDDAFKLYDTFGFPYDLTELMADEVKLSVDREGFDELMAEHKARGGFKSAVVEVSDGLDLPDTEFVGFRVLEESARIQEIVQHGDKAAIILDRTPFYAEMGGQVGDHGSLAGENQILNVVDTKKQGGAVLHIVDEDCELRSGDTVEAIVDVDRRLATQRHHTVTHLLHWALREVIGKESNQRGSFVSPDYLRFDFNHHSPVTPEQLKTIERLVNERIIGNIPVFAFERPRAEIAEVPEINQFFGDKYGDLVRVVQIGGHDGGLDGFSMELCGGTHSLETGDIGPFILRAESAISAGIRRIDAIAGHPAVARLQDHLGVLGWVSSRLTTPVGELEQRIESILETQKRLEKELKAMNRKLAAAKAGSLLDQVETINGVSVLAADVTALDSPPRDVLESIIGKLSSGIVVLGAGGDGACSFVVSVSKDLVERGFNAGAIARQVAQVAGGGGGGGAEKAQAGGRDPAKLGEALAKTASIVEAG